MDVEFCHRLSKHLWRRQWHPTPVLLPGKSHGWRSLVGCSPWGHQESDTTERLHFHFSLSYIGEGNGNPLKCSCLQNPRDSGAWWAAVYGIAQSRTRLKWLGSSSSSKHYPSIVALPDDWHTNHSTRDSAQQDPYLLLSYISPSLTLFLHQAWQTGISRLCLTFSSLYGLQENPKYAIKILSILGWLYLRYHLSQGAFPRFLQTTQSAYPVIIRFFFCLIFIFYHFLIKLPIIAQCILKYGQWH